jgi:clan AA aspartic protease
LKKLKDMGVVHAEITLINGDDVSLARKHHIGEEEIKKITVKALVDSGSIMMAINENIQSYLQLPVVERKPYEMADGTVVELDIVSPLDIKFKNRSTTCRALVLPGSSEVLLGLIPLEVMDVLIDPCRQELIVNPVHPEGAILRL